MDLKKEITIMIIKQWIQDGMTVDEAKQMWRDIENGKTNI